MTTPSRWRRAWDALMDWGAHDGETDIQRGKRRIVVGFFVFGAPTRLVYAAAVFGRGDAAAGIVLVVAAVLAVGALLVLRARPAWFLGIVNTMLFLQLLENLAETLTQDGLVGSGVAVLWGLLAVVGALIVLSHRAAFRWFAAFQLTVVLSVILADAFAADHEGAFDWNIALTIMLATTFVFAGMMYFVRQRDRFQAESDDLLHNILPDAVVRRLKTERTMIADDYASASVLFADLVNFTPLSSQLAPGELVGLLNTVFTTFDGFVEELGLEKIKTVGDEYMVAAGVPVTRPDHADAIAELALRIRNYTEHHEFAGRSISLRIGINSGPVVAGIVGTHKFAYDLWGDVVNTASRMESEGIPGSIQISSATYDLIRDRFVCAPRGLIDVKGKGQMQTYLLLSRNDDTTTIP